MCQIMTYTCLKHLTSALASQVCQHKHREIRRHLSILPLLHSLRKRQYHIVSPGKVTPVRTVPDTIPKPLYAVHGSGAIMAPSKAEVKTDEQVEGMRRACALAANLLRFTGAYLEVGMTTEEIDSAVHEKCIAMGAYPSPLLYRDYPKSVCTSVNNVLCHGIPDSRKLCDGDIINVDITVFYKGFHGDTSATFLVGEVDEAGQRLVEVARRCRDVGVAVCRPGMEFGEIGHAIEKCAIAAGYTVVPEFCGHGIGEYFHGQPDIVHIDYPNSLTMKPGMTFTIEPIICDGFPDFKILDDNWTAVSLDNSRSAQFEHTVLITHCGVEVLTL
ncbi:methionine aminopeptidase 1D, mitochondrial-like [Babylonia areolata]|uniref:methionine aminopeptidase 1D, mitochondrial-like n=1 Tax=Babylonia areolata TaxID=304850 RepID=UPI003FD159E7